MIWIDNILDYSKTERGKLGLERISVDLRDWVEAALELVVLSAARKDLDLLDWTEGDALVRIKRV